MTRLSFNAHGARRDEPQRHWIDDMLLLQNARGQSLRRVGVEHGDGGLRDDRAFIHLGRDKMHGASVDLHAVGQRAFVRVQAFVRGQVGQGEHSTCARASAR